MVIDYTESCSTSFTSLESRAGELMLIDKIIERAIRDLDSIHDGYWRDDAREWLLATATNEFTLKQWSFEWCCIELGVNANLIRSALIKAGLLS